MRNLRRLFITLIALCLLPLAGVLISAGVAAAAGCELNEGVANSCVVLGVDIGGPLTTLFVLGWLSLLTLPLLVGVLAAWALAEATRRWRQKRKERRDVRAGEET